MQTLDVAGATVGDECRKAKTCTGVVHEIEASASHQKFYSANLNRYRISFGKTEPFVGKYGEIIGAL